ncbi:MAG: CHAT domain-containing protein [Symploca sp. SIO2E9]|nr:CHAT domain-containing protein [Symploca sp. SIO2E9]
MITNSKLLRRWFAYFAIACLSALICTVKLPAIATDITFNSIDHREGESSIETSVSPSPPLPISPPKAEGRRQEAEGRKFISPSPHLPISPSRTKGLVNKQTKSFEQQARTLYEAGQFSEASQLLEQALEGYQKQRDTIGQAVVLSNLALSYQQLGTWKEANQAIEQALNLLKQAPKDSPELSAVWTQALDVLGNLQLAQGQADKAVDSWEDSAKLYTQLGDSTRASRSRINQAQALQALGLYRQARLKLVSLGQTLQSQPDSLAKATNLRSLGDALRAIGNLDCNQQDSQNCLGATKVLQESLKISQKLQSPEAIAAVNLSLGNVAWAQRQVALAEEKRAQADRKATQALSYYQQAIAESVNPIQTQAKLNRLHVLVELRRWQEAQALYPQVQQEIAKLPPGREKIYAQVNLAINLRKLSTKNQKTGTFTTPGVQEIAQILADGRQQAESLSDVRAQAHVLQELGQLYEKTQQFSFAQNLAQQSLNLSASINASEISYRAAWELGRIFKAQNKREEAIAAYTEAFDALQSVRSDLVAASAEVQFSFRESVEPVYRQLVDLLLQSAGEELQVSQKAGEKQLQSSAASIKSNQKKLTQARKVLEALQVAALQNYFQEACQDSKLELDQLVTRLGLERKEQKAAVIYPIILDDRLEVIVKMPDQEELYQYPPVRQSQEEVRRTLKKFQNNLQDEYRFKGVRRSGKTVYDWLIKPISDRLESSEIKTLVFLLDGSLRTVSMSALYDGKQFLVEKYSVSLVLGLEVRDPVPLKHESLKVLAASLTDPPQGFEQYGKLPNVNPELNKIKEAGVSLTSIRDENFTSNQFNQQLNQDNFQVVHLATHGQFGADRNSTFVLTADKQIFVDDLRNMFSTLVGTESKAVDLLVLSACKTASGNDRAVLGIAGTTVQAGARSAIAGLWSIADASSVKFSQTLYQNLGQPGITRAEALRQAQLALLNDRRYTHPRYWAPYVLVGAWL